MEATLAKKQLPVNFLDWLLSLINVGNDWNVEKKRLFQFKQSKDLFPELNEDEFESAMFACIPRMGRKIKGGLPKLVERYMTSQPANKQTIRMTKIAHSFGYTSAVEDAMLSILQEVVRQGKGRMTEQESDEKLKTDFQPLEYDRFAGMRPTAPPPSVPPAQSAAPPPPSPVQPVPPPPVATVQPTSPPELEPIEAKPETTLLSFEGQKPRGLKVAVILSFQRRFPGGEGLPERIEGQDKKNLTADLAELQMAYKPNSLYAAIPEARKEFLADPQQAIPQQVTQSSYSPNENRPAGVPLEPPKNLKDAILYSFEKRFQEGKGFPTGRLVGKNKENLLADLKAMDVKYSANYLAVAIPQARKQFLAMIEAGDLVHVPLPEVDQQLPASQKGANAIEPRSAQRKTRAKKTKRLSTERAVAEFLAKAYEGKQISHPLPENELVALTDHLDGLNLKYASSSLNIYIGKYRRVHNKALLETVAPPSVNKSSAIIPAEKVAAQISESTTSESAVNANQQEPPPPYSAEINLLYRDRVEKFLAKRYEGKEIPGHLEWVELDEMVEELDKIGVACKNTQVASFAYLYREQHNAALKNLAVPKIEVEQPPAPQVVKAANVAPQAATNGHGNFEELMKHIGQKAALYTFLSENPNGVAFLAQLLALDPGLEETSGLIKK